MTSNIEELVDNSAENTQESILLTIVSAFGSINNTESLKSLVLNKNIKSIYWIFIIQYGILAICGIITNIIIIIYVVYHKLFKDITHAFIINLCLCHIVQCSIVLPITLLVMLTENWIYGQFLCYFLPMLQDIPLHVAMISHLLIAWDRMRWLGNPLKGRLPTFVCCCASWLTGMVIALPYPIYTIFLDLGDYVRHLKGVGLCVVNLIDDMHEYMRGLFVIMYCGPVILLAYLYIRTSAELRPPDGPFAVMMFEHRAELRNRQRNPSTSSDRQSNGRQNSNRSYDLYSAELDVSLEKRTQRNLGSMAATQVLCVCPLMILRLAKMVMIETYENSKHFDFTYLMFVWIAFLPTIIFPGIYASQILPGTEKERIRGYFRMSSKKSHRISNENSIEQENTTTTEILNNPSALTINEKHNQGTAIISTSKITNQLFETNLNTKIKDDLNNNPKTRNYQQQQQQKFNGPSSAGKTLTSKMPNLIVQSSGLLQQPRRSFANSDSINNSCSNITSSTYCNNGSSIGDINYGLGGGGNPVCVNYVGAGGGIISGLGTNSRGSIDYDNASLLSNATSKDSYFDKKWLNTTLTSAATIGAQDAIQHKDIAFSDCGSRNSSSFTRNDSSSTFERDLEIIDLLERERSMDIQDMIQREIHGEFVRNYSMERRRLPDLEKICKSPKILDSYNRGSIDNSSNTTQLNYFPQSIQQQKLNRQNSNNSSAGGVGGGNGRKSKRNSLNTDISTVNENDNITNSSATTHLIGGFCESDVAGLGGANLIVGKNSSNNVCDNIISTSTTTATAITGKIPLLESRMKRNQRNQSSNTSFGRNSIKSRDRDYLNVKQNSPRPSLDFRENILAQL